MKVLFFLSGRNASIKSHVCFFLNGLSLYHIQINKKDSEEAPFAIDIKRGKISLDLRKKWPFLVTSIGTIYNQSQVCILFVHQITETGFYSVLFIEAFKVTLQMTEIIQKCQNYLNYYVFVYFLKVVSYLLHVAMQLSTSLKSPHNNIVLYYFNVVFFLMVHPKYILLVLRLTSI